MNKKKGLIIVINGLNKNHPMNNYDFISNEKQDLIEEIQKCMSGKLTLEQTKELNNVLIECLKDIEILDKIGKDGDTVEDNGDLLKVFISSKKIEGLAVRTLIYYENTVERCLMWVNKPISNITSSDIRNYLSAYKEKSGCSNKTLNNIRRIFSSFFGWIRDEGYIITNPMPRIKKIKEEKIIRQALSYEDIEKLRTYLYNNNLVRDLAIFELLLSSGIRVGELERIKIEDLNFNDNTLIVFGKGSKERKTFFNSKAKICIQNYLNTRTDDNPYLFVSVKKPFKRLALSGIGRRLRELGGGAGVENVHPHRFRRTMATNALNSGMPIEEIKEILGHESISTTLIYANVSENNIKNSYNKFVN